MGNIRVAFYDVVIPRHFKPGEEYEKIKPLDPVHRETEIRKGSVIRLQNYGGWSNGLYLLDLLRVRADGDVPLRVPADGEATAFERNPTDRAGECTAFLFDPIGNKLAVQTGTSGPTATAFLSFLMKHLGIKKQKNEKYGLIPIAERGFIDAVRAMARYSTVEVKIASNMSEPPSDVNAVRALTQTSPLTDGWVGMTARYSLDTDDANEVTEWIEQKFLSVLESTRGGADIVDDIKIDGLDTENNHIHRSYSEYIYKQDVEVSEDTTVFRWPSRSTALNAAFEMTAAKLKWSR